MNPVIDAEDPQLGDAMAQLDADIAAEATTPQAPTPPEADSATPAQPAPVPTPKEGVQPTPKADADNGTPANEVSQTPDNKSKYARSIERGFTSWQEFNQWKSDQRKLIENEQATIKAERDKLAQEREQFQKQQPQRKPEDYESYAANAEKEATALEADGKFDEATEVRVKAKLARAHAKNLRDNPPPAPVTDTQKEADFQKAQKEWWGKAAIDYPAVAKEGTPESEALKALIKSEPSVLGDPKGMYYAARLVSAESSSARVPTLTKDLDAARAKIKELEGKLTVSDGGSIPGNLNPVPYDQKSDDEKFAELEQQAKQIGYL